MRRIRLTASLTVLCAMTGALAATAVPAHAAPAYYKFVAEHSGKCLDVAYASTANAAAVVQASCRFTNNQRWRIKTNADGTKRIIAKHSGLCLDVANVDPADGARVVQARCWGGENQSWHVSRVG